MISVTTLSDSTIIKSIESITAQITLITNLGLTVKDHVLLFR